MKLDGVKKADVNWKKGEVVVRYDPAKVTPSQMTKAVNESGVFKVKAMEDLSEQTKRPR
jgi:copper chaperone CopZ